MSSSADQVLGELIAAVAPPKTPIGVSVHAKAPNLPALPPDLMKFIQAYGSGYFDIDGSIFLEVLNPYSDDYWAKQNRDLDTIRQLKLSEGDEYIPYEIYPDQPGLLLWGYGEDRKHFFWFTDGDPSVWPVIAMYDLEIFTRFDLSMLSFTKQLLCGEIDCSFIGGVDTANNHVDPQTCKFVQKETPA